MSISQFLRFGIIYFVIASLIAFLVRDNATDVIVEKVRILFSALPLLSLIAFMVLCVGLIINSISQSNSTLSIIVATAQATVATLCFQAGFLIFKTSMPYIIPFFADPAFLKLDYFLHFGIDPWDITHRLGQSFPLDGLASIYLGGWLSIALILPIVLAALDGNTTRVQRTMVLYVSSWVIIGNMLALAGLSVGPIFYDRLYGGDYFSVMSQSLEPISPNMQIIRNTQEGLWILYTNFDQSMGTGISAFPSVHVSVATLAAIYLFERSPYLLPVSIAWISAILFMSIYTGYHYAIDGYVSIIVIMGLWLFLRRRDRLTAQYAQ